MNIRTRMKWNGYTSLDTVENICHALNCGVDDILEFVLDVKDDQITCG